MASEIISRDQNRVTVLGGITDNAAQDISMLRVDPTSKRLKISGVISGVGSGTVTDVSVVTANGVSGSVATSTTTPAITLTLGAITPTSVNGLTISTTTGTFTLTNAKTLAVTNTLTLSGTDSTVMTFPSTSATIARTDAANTFTGASTASAWVLTSPTITTKISPTTDDGAPLGDTTHNFSDIFLASGALMNFANSNVVITHSSGILTMGTGEMRITTVGTNTASVVTMGGTQTLTNKRITPRVQSVADAATITPNADSDDCVDITAIAQAFTIASPSGTPTNFQKLIVRIKDNGTARAITFGAGYVAGGVALPTTTILSKILTLGFIYNTANSLNKWQLVASAQEA